MSEKSKDCMIVGRFAPSPTGSLHLGSLVTAVGSYCLARREGGHWLLRIEDLDLPRVVPGAADDILRTLEVLGLHWDGEVVYQSRRSERYAEALEQLRSRALVFDCGCSRKEVLASAPHLGEEGPVYPGTCRHGLPRGRHARSQRVRVPEQVVQFVDGVQGPVHQCLGEAVGDFVLRRADGIYAYQLAVVVDDADAGVNQVVRGMDLLLSTPRQIYLHACLGTPAPAYVHLPLAMAPDGEKLSKRHGAVSLAASGTGNELLCRALGFLGQEVPRPLQGDAPEAILSWAVAHFDAARIPSSSAELPPA